MLLGRRMRKLRLARGMTQKELADPNYSYAYVSTIEAGRRTPSREAVEHFARRLGVSPEELLTGRPADLEARLELRLQEAIVAMSAGAMDESSQAFGSIAKEAKRSDLPRIQAKAEGALGLWCERHSQPEEGLAHHQIAEDLLSGEPPVEWVDAVAGKARCLEALGDLRYAIFLLESLLDRLEREKLRDPDALSRLHASLVFAYLEAGLLRKAAASGEELLALAPQLTDPVRVAQMHMNVARLFLEEGRVEDAQRSLRRADEVYRQRDLKTESAGAHLALGYVASREGNLADARSELKHAIAIFEETANEPDLIRALNELARVERLEGAVDSARELLERSIALTGSSDAPILAWAHRELGSTFADDDASAAEKHFRMAIDIFERSEQPFEIAITYRALGDVLHGRGEIEAASDAYRTGIMSLEPAG
jgi:tetratricopeptide (TPR) repeat protein